jgi:glutamate racemase
VPYGNRPPLEIIDLTNTAIQPLLKAKCEIIVLACNTVTAIAIDELRKKYPNQKFIGIEPMIKTAAKMTRSKIITVCATPATLKSGRYKKLVKDFGDNLKIIEPDCSNWAKMIEDNQINNQQIDETIQRTCDQGADVIVLGCTHYYWIKEHIAKLCRNRAKIIEPSKAICQRVKKLLKSS